MKFLGRRNLSDLLDALSRKWDVFVPTGRDGRRYFRRWPVPIDDAVIGEVRTVEPLKGHFFRPRERVADGFRPELPAASTRAPCFVGVSACDLKGFEIQDFVFAPPSDSDPFYARIREKALIIAADCTTPLDTCFCSSLGVEPYPTSECDIAVSAVSNGFVVQAISELGRGLIAEHAELFSDATESQQTERAESRARAKRAVAANAQTHEVPSHESFGGMIARNYEASIWKEEAARCVECGACNTVCPTCHCFVLCDHMEDGRFARFRMWDSCLLKDFARAAGGANPRPELWMRLRNRFEKKFDFFPKVSGMYACTGCGRCIAACPARIDIRHVLSRLVSHG